MDNYKETRPWGTFEILLDDSCCKVKKITVHPGKRLSLQSHKHRHEHWIVTEGSLRITIGDTIAEYQVNEHVYIPQETKHRMENTSKLPASIIEVQIGCYFGEDDIIRYEDDYGRN